MFSYQRLSGPELRQRFPQWTVPDNTVALYQAQGGLVDAALANSVHIQLAQAHGATVLEEAVVKKLEPTSGDQCVVSII
jgi:sarcosine oxidase